MRKILIYALFLILGGIAGWSLVKLVKSKTVLPHLGGILLLAAVICLSIWAAYIVIEVQASKKAKAVIPEEFDKPVEVKEAEKVEEKAEERHPERQEPIMKKIRSPSNTAWLIPRGDEPKTGFPISKDNVYIGRNPTNDILLNDESVSRKHANITRVGGVYTIFDLNSKNGTFVNSQRVQKQILKDGDIIVMGNLSFVFRAAEAITEEAVEALPEVIPGEVELVHDSMEFEEDVPTRTKRAPAMEERPTGTKKAPPVDQSPTRTKKAGIRKYPDDKPQA
ncbi:MAG: FHA domain-containing protein [Candidatus Eremiobacteraeota bacterium]|nr:FHA domain-containing protein [Candidatus Eremiobacteraeota bacterium]